jgi:hypothetical protein
MIIRSEPGKLFQTGRRFTAGREPWGKPEPDAQKGIFTAIHSGGNQVCRERGAIILPILIATMSMHICNTKRLSRKITT